MGKQEYVILEPVLVTGCHTDRYCQCLVCKLITRALCEKQNIIGPSLVLRFSLVGCLPVYCPSDNSLFFFSFVFFFCPHSSATEEKNKVGITRLWKRVERLRGQLIRNLVHDNVSKTSPTTPICSQTLALEPPLRQLHSGISK